MKIRVVLHYLSIIVIGTGLAMLVPLVISLTTGDGTAGPFVISCFGTTGAGFASAG